jgi:hypothetical protein
MTRWTILWATLAIAMAADLCQRQETKPPCTIPVPVL